MAMAERRGVGVAAAKGDLKVVCEGVTRNLGLRDEGKGGEGDDALLIPFL